jgi:hypothetical protein
MGVPANFTTRSAVASAPAQKQRVLLLTSNIVIACASALLSDCYNSIVAATPLYLASTDRPTMPDVRPNPPPSARRVTDAHTD